MPSNADDDPPPDPVLNESVSVSETPDSDDPAGKGINETRKAKKPKGNRRADGMPVGRPFSPGISGNRRGRPPNKDKDKRLEPELRAIHTEVVSLKVGKTDRRVEMPAYRAAYVNLRNHALSADPKIAVRALALYFKELERCGLAGDPRVFLSLGQQDGTAADPDLAADVAEFHRRIEGMAERLQEERQKEVEAKIDAAVKHALDEAAKGNWPSPSNPK